jgi:hypothetical protein
MTEEVERNKLEALELADRIFQAVTNKKFLNAVSDPEIRHKMIVNKYPNFAKAYPVVLRYLARDLKYHNRAFRLFLDKLQRDPGTGMQGFIERQADYAKFLYLEINRNNHANRKAAQRLWTMEYENMSRWHKKLLAEEKDAKNEFADESQENMDLKRKELLDFINQEETNTLHDEDRLDTFHEDAERMKYGLPLKNPKPTFHDIDPDCLDYEELIFLLREMRSYEDQLLTGLENRNMAIEQMELRAEMIAAGFEDPYKSKPPEPEPERGTKLPKPAENEWLVGTSVTINRRRRGK